jgi:hypothetical protein
VCVGVFMYDVSVMCVCVCVCVCVSVHIQPYIWPRTSFL